MRRTIMAAALLAACGGATVQQAPPPVAPEAGGADPSAYAAVAEVFAKKRPIVSQCYGTAVENRELTEDAKGRVKVGLRVLPSGQAENVHIVESSLGSKSVEDCVVKLVQRWTLPAPDKALDFIYTYEFANQ